MAYIVRLDKPKDSSKGTHGWQVRGPGKRGYHSKLFSDRKYGGRNEALEAAREYLKEVEEKYPPQKAEGVVLRDEPLSNNQSGILGVYRSHQYHSKTGELEEYWGAYCRLGPDGNPYLKKYYICGQRDDEEAFHLAVEFRQMWKAAADQGAAQVRRFWAEVESGWL